MCWETGFQALTASQCDKDCVDMRFPHTSGTVWGSFHYHSSWDDGREVCGETGLCGGLTCTC